MALHDVCRLVVYVAHVQVMSLGQSALRLLELLFRCCVAMLALTFAFVGAAEFNGERIVEHHMERMGGREQLLQQMYAAMATRRDDTVDLALRSYGALPPETLPIPSNLVGTGDGTNNWPCAPIVSCSCFCPETLTLLPCPFLVWVLPHRWVPAVTTVRAPLSDPPVGGQLGTAC